MTDLNSTAALEAAIERRKNTMRGNLAQAVASLAAATHSLGHTIRTSPMSGMWPATEAGIDEAERRMGEASTKMRIALAEANGIALLETELSAGAFDEEAR